MICLTEHKCISFLLTNYCCQKIITNQIYFYLNAFIKLLSKYYGWVGDIAKLYSDISILLISL